MPFPGIDPWQQVVRNPQIWHFAFHAVSELPEILVAGHVGHYFDLFYGAIAARPEAITTAARIAYVDAYSRPEALKAGFDCYRAFAEDEKDNREPTSMTMPFLYLRGDHDAGALGDYLGGLRSASLHDLTGELIRGAGHFLPEETPDALAVRLAAFHPARKT
jgi:pimeloyl-ACP methyl ester carboxylesterase